MQSTVSARGKTGRPFQIIWYKFIYCIIIQYIFIYCCKIVDFCIDYAADGLGEDEDRDGVACSSLYNINLFIIIL